MLKSKSERKKLEKKRKIEQSEKYRMKLKKLEEEINETSDDSDEELEDGQISDTIEVNSSSAVERGAITTNAQPSTSSLQSRMLTPKTKFTVDPDELFGPDEVTGQANPIHVDNERVEQQAGSSASKTQGSTSISENDLWGALNESELSEYGEKINDNIAKKILPILKNGLSEDIKKRYCNMYMVPDNCRLLQAPALNDDIPGIKRHDINRDKRMSDAQSQLGLAITATCRAMELVSQGVDDKVQVMNHLNKSNVILSELHHYFTQTRKWILLPHLDLNYEKILRDSESDDTLFGNDILEKINKHRIKLRQNSPIHSTGRGSANPRPNNIRPPSPSQLPPESVRSTNRSQSGVRNRRGQFKIPPIGRPAPQGR